MKIKAQAVKNNQNNMKTIFRAIIIFMLIACMLVPTFATVVYADSLSVTPDTEQEAPTDEDGNQISSDTPKEQPVMTSVSVETYGVDYGIPETVQPFDLSSIYSQLMGY